ncbi:MAG TPA: serine hydrolase [Ktedonobacterales bacterium]|nr:serine hydrolase [Ktedonobacterales bacterium]
MRERRVIGAVRSMGWRQSRITQRAGIAAIVAVLWLVPLISMSAWESNHRPQPARVKATDTFHITNGAALWEHDTRTTAATASASASLNEKLSLHAVDPAFQTYYDTFAGKITLGAPLTVAYPVRQGWVQFFTLGALLLPGSQTTATTDASANALPDEVVRAGLVDSASGIVRLPVLHALLTVGSDIPIGGGDSPLTYATLRDATRAEAMVTAPTNATVISPDSGARSTPAATVSSTATASNTGNVFVPGGTRNTVVIGHIIPAALWQYINQPQIAPGGWQTNFGSPLTEALPFTASVDGSPHAMLVQAFWHEALLVDTTAVDASGQPTIMPLSAGLDYLQTLGPPAATVSANEQVWGSSDLAVLNVPETGNALVHVGLNFPLTLTGETQWLNNALWYGVRWQGLKTSGTGWTLARMITFTPPGSRAPAWAGFDVLSPQLATYLRGLGNTAGAAVYDVTRNVYYTYNAGGQFIMASSAKVPIMLTFLTMTESQGREPNGNEMYLLQTMIENSDNNSAQALFDEIGGVGPMAAFLHSVHISGFNGNPDAWGWSTITPVAMVQMLTLLHEGKVLTAQDRSLALNLMENIESDEQTGVGTTAPAGATVAMKDGWVPAPDGLWAMNSSGIVTLGDETYVIAVYSQEQQSLQDGWTITEQVCGQVGKLLT